MVSQRLQKYQNKISVVNKAGRRGPLEGSNTLRGGQEEALRTTIVLDGPKGEEAVATGFQPKDIGVEPYSGRSMGALERERTLFPVCTAGETMDDELFALRSENARLKQLTEKLMQQNQVLKKRLTGLGWSCE